MRSLCVLVVIVIIVKCFAGEVRQEGAKIDYCNPKYVADCYGITLRRRRGDPYRTNLTAIIKQPWGNNVTIMAELHGGIIVQLVKTKLCDAVNVDWFYDYLKTYGHIDGRCPYLPGQYGLYNMEFPPKNMPMKITKLVNGNFRLKGYFLVTATEEVIVESTITFRKMS